VGRVAVGLGAAHRGVEVVPDEVAEEREARRERAHVLVEVVAVKGVDDGVDVDRHARLSPRFELGVERAEVL
jgi:hypothetical protein